MECEDKPCGLAEVYEFVDLYSTKVLNFRLCWKIVWFLVAYGSKQTACTCACLWAICVRMQNRISQYKQSSLYCP